MKKLILLSIASFLLQCGSNPKIAIVISPTSALQCAKAVDIVITAISQFGPYGIVDLDHNGVGDTFIYPQACNNNSSPAGCGILLAQAGNFEFGELPMPYQYSISANIRDVNGSQLFSGSYQLLDPSLKTIPITVTGTCPP